ncbi:MAG: ABC transporter permease [Eubacteriaceae bacterium]|nr:ABC transporter permease [Eubacteriaceae bacterium]
MKDKSFSQEYIAYINGIKRKNVYIAIWRYFILALFIALWQINDSARWIDPFIASSPLRVGRTLYRLAVQGGLFRHACITVMETVFGFVSGTLLGTAIAIALWWYPSMARVLDPYIVILNALPKVALGPLILVVAGIGLKSILIMALAISLISTVISVHSGFIQTDEERITLLLAFGATKWQLLTKAILPSSFENILSALKVNIGLSWVGVIMGEFLVSKAGIGYLIMYGSQVFNMDLVVTGILILSVAAGIMYLAVNYIVSQIKKFIRS